MSLVFGVIFVIIALLALISFISSFFDNEAIPTFLICLVICGLMLLGYYAGKKDMELNCVKIGVAKYIVNKDNEIEFMFLPPVSKNIEDTKK